MYTDEYLSGRYVLRIVLSLAVSAAVLAVLAGSLGSALNGELQATVLRVLLASSGGYILVYGLSGLVQAWIRAQRYRILLQATGERLPGRFHLFLVTLSRNMFVDLLPARLGELSYVAMLNRGYRVGMNACLASLAISFVFDLLALLLLMAGLLTLQWLTSEVQGWLMGSLFVLSCLCCCLWFLLFSGTGRLSVLAGRLARKPGVVGKLGVVVVDTVKAVSTTRKQGVLTKTLLLSLGVRGVKYLGLYTLFLAVVTPSYKVLASMEIGKVLAALISAEAAAALPVPAFLSFGTYEAGGSLAMVALGMAKSNSLVIMLCIHMLSQVVDYTLGLCAFLLFVLKAVPVSRVKSAGRPEGIWKRGITLGCLALVLFTSLGVLARKAMNLKKIGTLSPPPAGRSTGNGALMNDRRLDHLEGFLVWSSNRFGNHDIIKLTLPERTFTRLTSHPHAEYYPRISPDGRLLAFCRSREPWVSQRNSRGWDVYILDLSSGEEHLVAKQANVPTWSEDGKILYFQRDGSKVVAVVLETREERVIAASGENIPLPGDVELQTPDWGERHGKLAVTLRGGKRGTVLLNSEQVWPIDQGCQLFWAPGESYLYFVGHGGKGKNAFYKVNPLDLHKQLWFDAEGMYSHEYFPRVIRGGRYLVYGASAGGHEHDSADYEIFLWEIGQPSGESIRITFHSGNDCWPDAYFTNQNME